MASPAIIREVVATAMRTGKDHYSPERQARIWEQVEGIIDRYQDPGSNLDLLKRLDEIFENSKTAQVHRG